MSKKSTWWVLFASLLLALSACGGDATNTGPAGSMDLNLQLAGDVDLDTVDYSITGNGIDEISGTIDVAGQSSIFLQIRRIPQGSGFLLELDALDGTTTCSATATFNITAGQVTPVGVVFICDRSSDTGGVEITGSSAQFCPRLTDMTAAMQNNGAAFAMSAAAADEEDDLITFQWSAPSGSFTPPSSVDAAAATSTFNCDANGDVELTVSVSDDGFAQCDESAAITVTCSGVVVGQASPAIAYRANQESLPNQEIFVAGWDGSGNQKISGPIQASGIVYFFKWSPDGSKMAFIADRETDNVPELYVVDADGSNLVKVSLPVNDAGVSTDDFEWSPDGSRIAYIARVNLGDPAELYTNLPDGSDNRVINSPPPHISSSVRSFHWSPDSSRIAYVGYDQAGHGPELFTNNVLGTNEQKINPTYTYPQRIASSLNAIAWSPNSQWIAYLAQQDTPNRDELYVGRPDGLGWYKVSGPLQPNGEVEGNGPQPAFAWSPNSSRIAYRADANLDGYFELFTVSATGTAHVAASGPMASAPGVEYFSWSPTGSLVGYTATQLVSNRPDLYTVGASDTAVSQVGDVTISGVQGATDYDDAFLWIQNGTRIIYRADSPASSGDMELFNTPLSGGGAIRVNGPMPPGTNVDYFVLSPDGSRVAYLADQDTPGQLDLYSSTVTGAFNTRLSGPSLSGNGVTTRLAFHETIKWSPDSSRIAYLNDEDLSGQTELYTSTPDGSANAKVNGPMVHPAADVQTHNLEWKP